MQNNAPTVSVQAVIRSEKAQELIEQSLGDRKQEFSASVLSVVNSNPQLQNCDPFSVIKACMQAATINLPFDNNRGFAYIIPYNNKKKIKTLKTKPDGEPILDAQGQKIYKEEYKWVTEAQFQIGWKGFVQLALRSGEYVRINVTHIGAEEIVTENPITGDIEVNWITKDPDERKKLEVGGYLSYVRMKNGFEKFHYMSVENLQKHAKKFSKSYQKGYGNWVDDFDNMSRKTVLKLLLSKYGLLSADLIKAVEADQAAMGEDDTYKYVDNEKDDKPEDKEPPTPKAPEHKDVIDGEVVEAEKNQAKDVDQSKQTMPKKYEKHFDEDMYSSLADEFMTKLADKDFGYEMDGFHKWLDDEVVPAFEKTKEKKAKK